jgi:hypothetical protein
MDLATFIGELREEMATELAALNEAPDYPNHTALARRLQDYLRWRNTHARHPDVLVAQRRERARIRSERQQRWGRPKPKAA